MKIKGLIAALGLSLGFAGAVQAAVDPKLPTYQKAAGVSGNLSSIGSDTLNNLMTLWAEGFKKQYPNVNIQIQGAGSSTAPPAMEQGTANLGPMSRPMKDNEIQAFEKKHGYKPTAVPVAIDALAVFVHKDNPIKGLSMPLVDAVFSATRKCGYEKEVTKWSDLGVSGSLANQNLQIFGRNSVSGTYGYFKEHALCKGDFKKNVNEQPGSASVVQSVSTAINGIGYSGLGYKTSSVRTVPLKGSDGEFYDANEKNAISGKYPLARPLLVYVNKHPNKALPPLEAEFFRFVLSKQGQEVVDKDGYIPMPESEAAKIRKMLGL
ncbi:MAG: PstS family phosphate ABC transporter substrate-binding protein [Moraxellaceae bacterium]